MRSGGNGVDDLAEVGPVEAQAMLEDGAVLLDVREPDEWSAGHAPSALHIPLGELGERFGELPAEVPLVAVCRAGGRSARAAEALVGAGRRCINLTGGMQSWEAAGLPVVDEHGGPGTII